MKLVRSAALAFLAVLSFVFALAVTAAPAQAQATRTWVSGVGDDVNPCSRTAPCKTFAGAISKTAAGGEINCLDPGGFGTVTITKSITIDCEDTQGSILSSGTNGVNVNDSASGSPNTIRVILRGLSINGAGTTTGLSGVNFTSGASVTIEKCIIQNFNTSPANGIRVAVSGGSAPAELYVSDTTIVNSGIGPTTGGGIEIRPTGTGSAKVDLINVRMANSAAAGIRVDSTSTTNAAGINVMMRNVEISGGVRAIDVNSTTGVSGATVMVIDSALFGNSSFGILANGGNSRVRVANTVITSNDIGVNPIGGAFINDLGLNILIGNASNGSFN